MTAPRIVVPETPRLSRPLASAPLLRDSGKPLHSQLQAVLREMILKDFKPGDAFFTEREIEDHFEVSKVTVRRALNDIGREGLIVRRRGAATTIAAGHRASPARDAAPAPEPRNLARAAPSAATTRRITGILTSDLSEEYGASLTSQLLQASLDRGIQVRCYPVPTPQSAANLFNSLSPGEDGHGYVLFTEGPVMQFLNHVLLARGCRTISVEGLELDAPFSYVMTDSSAVVTIGMEHLLSLGHRRIVLFVHSEPNHPTVHVKIERFREMVAEHGLEGEARVFTWHDVPGAAHLDEKRLMASMMEGLWRQRAEKPTAIFSVVDLGAWAAMDWLWRQGIDVPGEVSVLGFENLVTSQYTRPALTTVAHPMKEIATRAIEALWAEPYDPNLHQLVEPHLVVRESTGPAPA